jgi:hypothetical protein
LDIELKKEFKFDEKKVFTSPKKKSKTRESYKQMINRAKEARIAGATVYYYVILDCASVIFCRIDFTESGFAVSCLGPKKFGGTYKEEKFYPPAENSLPEEGFKIFLNLIVFRMKGNGQPALGIV